MENLDQQPNHTPATSGAGNSGSGGQFTLLDDGTLVMNGGAKFVPVDRFNGLNNLVQKLTDEKRGLQAQVTELNGTHTQAAAELQSQLKELSTAKTTLEQQIAELNGQTQTLSGEKEKLSGELNVTKLFLTDKFAPLASSYAKGTINLKGFDSQEDVETYLASILDERQQLLAQTVEQQSAGTSPSSPQGGSNAIDLNTAQLAAKLASLPPNSPEYQPTYQAWMASLEKK